MNTIVKNKTGILLQKALANLNKQLDLVNKGHILSKTEAQQLQDLRVNIIKLRNTFILLLDKNNKRSLAMKIFDITSARVSQIKKNLC